MFFIYAADILVSPNVQHFLTSLCYPTFSPRDADNVAAHYPMCTTLEAKDRGAPYVIITGNDLETRGQEINAFFKAFPDKKLVVDYEGQDLSLI